MQTFLGNISILCAFVGVGRLVVQPENTDVGLWILLMIAYASFSIFMIRVLGSVSSKTLTVISYFLINSAYALHVFAAYS